MSSAARIELLETRIRQLEDRIDALETALGLNVIPHVGLGLTQAEARIFGMLLERDAVTREQLMIGLYATRPDGEIPEPKIIDVMVCKLRRKLSRFNIGINTIRGQGYRIDLAGKMRAQALIGDKRRCA